LELRLQEYGEEKEYGGTVRKENFFPREYNKPTRNGREKKLTIIYVA
jgi:hypothetical protein